MIIEHKKLELFGKKVFEFMIVKPPFVKFHLMDNEACYLHVIEGKSVTISEIDKISLESNESVLMKCGNYITNMATTRSNNYFHSFAVHFHLDVLKKIYKNELPTFLTTDKNVSTKSFAKIEPRTLLINHFMEGMKLHFQYPSNSIKEDLLILKLKEIILLLHQNDESNSVHDILASLFSPVTYNIKQVIDAHLYTNISVDQLSSLCNMSISTFKREFNKIFKSPPATYLKYKKLEKSEKLLIHSKKRINEIASECGFVDVSHFSKSFVQKYGTNPSKYRLNQID